MVHFESMLSHPLLNLHNLLIKCISLWKNNFRNGWELMSIYIDILLTRILEATFLEFLTDLNSFNSFPLLILWWQTLETQETTAD